MALRLAVTLGLAVPEGVGETVGVWVADPVNDGVKVRLQIAVDEADAVGVAVRLGLGVCVLKGEAVGEGLDTAQALRESSSMAQTMGLSSLPKNETASDPLLMLSTVLTSKA